MSRTAIIIDMTYQRHQLNRKNKQITTDNTHVTKIDKIILNRQIILFQKPRPTGPWILQVYISS